MKKKYLIKAACLFSVAMLMGCAQEEDNSKTEKKGRASYQLLLDRERLCYLAYKVQW